MSTDVKTEAAEKKETMKIKVAQEDKLVFPSIAYSEITSSDKLCKDARPLFSVFGDFVGFGVNFNQLNGLFTMSAYFKQVDESDTGFKAFSRDITSKSDQSRGIQRIQRFDRVASEGNKFHLEDDAAEMIAPFMHRTVYTNNGEVNWDRNGVVTTRAIQSSFAAPITYSVINFIDPIKILREMYGAKANVYVGNSDGAPVIEEREVSYQIFVMGSIASMTPNPYGGPMQENPEGPFKLDIRQVDVNETHKAAKEVGLNIQIGPRIISE